MSKEKKEEEKELPDAFATDAEDEWNVQTRERSGGNNIAPPGSRPKSLSATSAKPAASGGTNSLGGGPSSPLKITEKKPDLGSITELKNLLKSGSVGEEKPKALDNKGCHMTKTISSSLLIAGGVFFIIAGAASIASAVTGNVTGIPLGAAGLGLGITMLAAGLGGVSLGCCCCWTKFFRHDSVDEPGKSKGRGKEPAIEPQA